MFSENTDGIHMVHLSLFQIYFSSILNLETFGPKALYFGNVLFS